MIRTRLHPDRYLLAESSTREIARELYQTVARLSTVSPPGHGDARLFGDSTATFATPANLFIIPDSCVTRMLCSQGILMGSLLERNHRTFVTGAVIPIDEWFSAFRGVGQRMVYVDE